MDTKENVASTNIQAELNRLWDTQPGSSKAKACLFNLIIYTQETCRSDYFKDMVRMIIEQFPCRIIFIQGDRSTHDSYLRVHVSAETGKDKRGMACDQILIEAAGKDLSRVPYLILPLFIPGLPIYLLWGEDPTTENTVLPHLQKFATRLIFDSECTEDLQHFSQIMQQKLNSSSIQVVDMNWARIGGWREILAQTFDSKERLAQLASVQYVKIIYNDLHSPFFRHPDTQAIYLQAWLASRLGWKFIKSEKKENTLVLNYQGQQDPIQIDLVADTRTDLLPEDIIAAEVSNQKNYICNLMRQGNNQVVVHASNQYQCELPFTLWLPTIRSGRSFMQEIFYQKVSDHYSEMLNLISKTKWS
ncbi:Glucose-6-phosphate dehydrogenase family protein [Candidatus Protochlamydia naegleriophila]|uniref:Glucose-6-phosphate dehydrogenase family protein n=1 Tax=Candidatus Protochlamydia naegleriophila TaxID=389348 RepID=A0A0U5J9X5_9BACT|nr:glucose-6-phosphate dehydrogenase assembly protein OpcA [Candidatus Protochlamydia naegleriophila]CUI16600.1 Glucose-6-phosphate dehydrogenase family protein [Candidatus Protochlamydia naegleriophila]